MATTEDLLSQILTRATLKAQNINAQNEDIAVEWVGWSSGQVTKTRSVYAARGVWTLDAFESDVTWARAHGKIYSSPLSNAKILKRS